MRMDVSYFASPTAAAATTALRRPASYAAPAPTRAWICQQHDRRRDGLGAPTSVPTLRITLTLYATDGGKVLWAASASCPTQADKAQNAGDAIINRIFDSADKS